MTVNSSCTVEPRGGCCGFWQQALTIEPIEVGLRTYLYIVARLKSA